MGAEPIQASDFCKQTHKINIEIAWKIANVNMSRYITSEPKKSLA